MVNSVRALHELYRRVVTGSTAQSVARQDLVLFLVDRIETLWIESRAIPDSPLIAVPDSPHCRVAHRANRWFHPSFRYFQALELPKPTLNEYFQRIVQYCELSGEAIIRAMFLLAYFRYRMQALFPVTPFTIHRLLIASLLCAAKFGEDRPWSNLHFAKYGLLEPSALLRLEKEFLCLIEWQVCVPDHQLESFFKSLLATRPNGCMLLSAQKTFYEALLAVTTPSFHEICQEMFPKLDAPKKTPSLPHAKSKSSTADSKSYGGASCAFCGSASCASCGGGPPAVKAVPIMTMMIIPSPNSANLGITKPSIVPNNAFKMDDLLDYLPN